MANEPKEISFHFYQSKISKKILEPETLDIFPEHKLPPPPSLYDIFHFLINDKQESLPSKIFDANSVQEIKQIKKVDNYFLACFRKTQHSNLPKTGIPDSNEKEKDLKLDQDIKEGLLAENWLLIVPRHNILIFQQNRKSGTPKQLTKYLNKSLRKYLNTSKLSLTPVIDLNAWKKLMNDQVIIRKLDLKIANNTPQHLSENDWSSNVFSILQESNGSNLHLKISADLKNKNSKFNRLKNSLAPLLRKLITKTDNVDSARFHIKQSADQDEEIIDMILQSLNSKKMVEMIGSDPSPIGIERALLEVYHEQEAVINEIFYPN